MAATTLSSSLFGLNAVLPAPRDDSLDDAEVSATNDEHPIDEEVLLPHEEEVDPTDSTKEERLDALGHAKSLFFSVYQYAVSQSRKSALGNMFRTLLRQTGVSMPSQAPYIDYVTRDLDKIVEFVVPNSRDGLINFQSARQILESWQTKRVLDPIAVANVVETLDNKKSSLSDIPPTRSINSASERDEIFKRIEEDRERHKLLRQRRWNIPTRAGQPYVPRLASAVPTTRILPQNPTPTSPTSPVVPSAQLTSPIVPTTNLDPSSSPITGSMLPLVPKHLPPRHALRKSYTEAQLELEVKMHKKQRWISSFEQAWETTSDWNEDDIDAVTEEWGQCWGEESWEVNAQEDNGYPNGKEKAV
ncbi:CTD kinase subunit gamma CTK3 protein [Ceratobasidium sp. AG-Ba]|nr:CTD kinase subunit gamma CTK3 protein [Ceratobasidium sp. AG-Ba]